MRVHGVCSNQGVYVVAEQGLWVRNGRAGGKQGQAGQAQKCEQHVATCASEYISRAYLPLPC